MTNNTHIIYADGKWSMVEIVPEDCPCPTLLKTSFTAQCELERGHEHLSGCIHHERTQEYLKKSWWKRILSPDPRKYYQKLYENIVQPEKLIEKIWK